MSQYPEHIFEDPKLRILLDPNDKRSAALGLSIREQYPSFTVWTKDQNDQINHGRIDGAMEPKTFYKVISELERVATSPVPTETVVCNEGHVIRKGQPLGPKQLMSKMRIARDADGVCTISITAGKNRPVLVFTPTDDEYHNFQRDGQQLSLAENSQLMMRSLARMWSELYSATLGRIGSKPKWLKDFAAERAQGGQGGGGYQQQNQGGGGYQQRQQQQQNYNNFDDDIPI